MLVLTHQARWCRPDQTPIGAVEWLPLIGGQRFFLFSLLKPESSGCHLDLNSPHVNFGREKKKKKKNLDSATQTHTDFKEAEL